MVTACHPKSQRVPLVGGRPRQVRDRQTGMQGVWYRFYLVAYRGEREKGEERKGREREAQREKQGR